MRFAALALLFCVLSGCPARNPTVVSGLVTSDGKPLEGARVRFVPKDNPDLGTAIATTAADGTFVIQPDAHNNNLLSPGTFLVLIDKEVAKDPAGAMGAPVENVVPAQYSQVKLTPLRVEITEGENKLPAFEVGGSKK